LTFGELHGVVSQKIEHFITTAMRIPKPVCNYVKLLNFDKELEVDHPERFFVIFVV
jgi:hypothetical protein